MRVVHDRPEVRPLPSRRRFALTRLIALLAPANDDGGAEHIVLAIDPDQTPAESHLACFWFTATLACYMAVVLPVILPLALVVAVPLAVLSIPVICMLATLPLPDGDNTDVSSAALFIVLAIASAYFALQPSWVRFVAWFSLGVLIANALSAAILWLLRGRMRQLEARCGA